MLAREYDHPTRLKKPIILSHVMIAGLKRNQVKMSKGDPTSAIFMDDFVDVVQEKIKKAYCAGKILFLLLVLS